MTRVMRLLRRATALRDRRGAALIEFAFTFPILMTIFAAGLQLSNAISCNRKVTIATRTISDLLSQNTTGSTTTAEINTDLAATTQVMAPFKASAATIRISQITTDNSYNSSVVWSKALNGSAYSVNQSVTLPAALRVPGSYFLFAEMTYAYKPPLLFRFVGNITFKDSLYMLPRNTNKIDCTDC